MENQPGLVEKQFNLIKAGLRNAARAAGANLAELIEVPDNAAEIITMMPAALDKKHVMGNQDFVQTQS